MSENQNSNGDVPTTGHLWDDDLADLTNPPPRWWMMGLLASSIWVVAYWTMYPAIPISVAGVHFEGVGLPGTGKWTAIKEMEADQAVLDKFRSKYEDKLKDKSAAAILADDDLSEYVYRSGRVLFSDNCAACHGEKGVGSNQTNVNFAVHERGLMAPILVDDDWLFGGTIDDIHTSISGGRQAMMMSHKEMLSPAEIDELANAIAKSTPNATPLFAEKGCIGCHGVDGKGLSFMGSANLVDKLWRFDGSVEAIKQTIEYGVNSGDPKTRVAIMPSFTEAGKLSDVEIKKLAVYVYKLGGGQPSAQ